MKTASLTKKQARRVAALENQGYDAAHTSDRGNPVLVLRDKKIFVEVLPSGSYIPV